MEATKNQQKKKKINQVKSQLHIKAAGAALGVRGDPSEPPTGLRLRVVNDPEGIKK